MPGRPARFDRYGRPLPRPVEMPSRDLAGSQTNTQQRDRLLALLHAMLEEHYPHLLREAVTADVTLSFSVVRGTIQEDLYLGIVRRYRLGEE